MKDCAMQHKYSNYSHDEELRCFSAAQKDGMIIKFIDWDLLYPAEYKRLCMAAVEQNPMALMYVPEYLCDEDIYIAAVKRCWKTLKYVPKCHRNAFLCDVAVAQSGQALEYVPTKLKSLKRCTYALRDYVGAARFVPDQILKQLLCPVLN